jgi:hypothetical protein
VDKNEVKDGGKNMERGKKNITNAKSNPYEKEEAESCQGKYNS